MQLSAEDAVSAMVFERQKATTGGASNGSGNINLSKIRVGAKLQEVVQGRNDMKTVITKRLTIPLLTFIRLLLLGSPLLKCLFAILKIQMSSTMVIMIGSMIVIQTSMYGQILSHHFVF